MGRPYKGRFNIKIDRDSLNPEEAYYVVEVASEKINFFIRLLEAYEHLAFVLQLDPVNGRMGIYTTKDRSAELLEIINNLPFPVRII